MAALTLDALLRGLKKSSPGPVYFLYGDEDVLKNEAIRAILDAGLDPAARDFNLDTRFAADLDVETFHSLVHTLPLLAERRAVVIRGVELLGKRKSKLRDELLRYLHAPNPSTVLILVSSAGEEPDADLLKQAAGVVLEPLPPERVVRWVGHHAAGLKLEIDAEAVDDLIDAVGGDLGMLARELDKLAAAAGPEARPVTAADVAMLVGVRRGQTLQDLVTAALDRRAADAVPLIGPVLGQVGVTGVRIVTVLGLHLIGTAVARAERDRGKGDTQVESATFQLLLSVRPYSKELRGYKEEARRWTRWSGLWSAAELAAALRATLAADVALKTTTVTDDRGIVTQLVLGFAAVQREAA
ncbi:MAG: DNA polymerase III subunit delta [Gemmatimonadales bacterium]|nr:DNA polymerase III subunit delta [Gemmatimonadales bacterium]